MEKYLLQNVFIDYEKAKNSSGLYFTVSNFDFCEINDNNVVLKKGGCLSFASYYNIFSLKKWLKYTQIDSLFLQIKIKGKFRVNLVSIKSGEKKIVKSVLLNSQNIATDFVVPIPYDIDDDFISFSLEADELDSIFVSGFYFTNVKYINNIHLVLGICTYKKEKFVANNLSRIAKFVFDNQNNLLCDKLDIIISDNAKTLPPSICYNQHIHLFSNSNTGGSGGFARIMIEAHNLLNRINFSHLILMDDDIEFEIEALIRTFTVLSFLKVEYDSYFIGGSMFNLGEENIQHCSGEKWIYQFPWIQVISYNLELNMNSLSNVFNNEKIHDDLYQAWWYCAIPKKYIRLDNLPMPFFIRYDDMEYSARNAKDIILLNGICVAHSPFESRYLVSNEYYNARNSFISYSVLNFDVPKSTALLFLKKFTKRFVLSYQYEEQLLMCRGLTDFLKGPNFLKKVNHEALNFKLNRFNRKMYKPDHFKNIDFEKELSASLTSNVKSKNKFITRMTLNGLIIPSKKYTVLKMWGSNPKLTFSKKYVYFYEPKSKNCFVTKKSIFKSMVSFLLFFIVYAKIFFFYRKAKNNFYKHRNYFRNYDYWKRFI